MCSLDESIAAHKLVAKATTNRSSFPGSSMPNAPKENTNSPTPIRTPIQAASGFVAATLHSGATDDAGALVELDSATTAPHSPQNLCRVPTFFHNWSKTLSDLRFHRLRPSLAGRMQMGVNQRELYANTVYANTVDVQTAYFQTLGSARLSFESIGATNP